MPSTRDRPSKSPLSKEAVIAAGLQVLRDEGIDRVTMRRVAAVLDTGPASLYVYVASRDDLLDELFDTIAGEIPLPGEPDPERWRDQLAALLTDCRDVMDRHPGIARVPLTKVPTGPNATLLADRVIGLLRAGGVPEMSAAWFVDVVFLYINAACYETAVYQEAGTVKADVDERIKEDFSAFDPAAYPNMVALMPMLVSGTRDERFAFGLQLMINGLLTTESPPSPPTR